MIVTGWSNGAPNNSAGAGYGIRITKEDRDKHFQKEWSSVSIYLDNGTVLDVTLTPSFWKRCHELRNSGIGQWLLDNELAPWPRGKPPKLKLQLTKKRIFRLDISRA